MASTMIHMCIAKEINKELKRDEKKLLLGTIAPDLSKLIGEEKTKSHFLYIPEEEGLPDLNIFLKKYRSKLSDDFVMGYYIHLFVDYLWFKYFVTDFFKQNTIVTTNGSIIHLKGNQLKELIYNDYTNLNIGLIDEYNLDLSLFYEELPKLNNIIDEIDYTKLQIIVDNAGIIIENTKQNKEYIFNMRDIKQFINMCVIIILSEISSLRLNEEELEII